MRIIFMGTPEFAVPTLNALVRAGHDLAAAYTQPPRPGGRRGRELTPSPVQRRAEILGIPVQHPKSLKREQAQADFAAHDADIAVVAAYGLILPQVILDMPRHGCLNVHGSLLPRWRGAAPVQRAIMAGDEETGVTIMRMEAGLDTGPMLAKIATPIRRKTARALSEELAELGANLMVEVLQDFQAIKEIAQPETGVTYANKIDKIEARLDWGRPAIEIERLVRGLSPFPGAWFQREGQRVKLHAAEIIEQQGPAGTVLDDRLTIACGDFAIRPTRLQPAGKPAMAIEDYLRGRPAQAGTILE